METHLHQENNRVIKEKICEMINNEKSIFHDGYGRRWKYREYKFYFSDLGKNDYKIGLECIHLLSTAKMKISKV